MLFSTITTIVLSLGTLATAHVEPFSGAAKVTARRYNHRQLAARSPPALSSPKASGPLTKRRTPKKRKTCSASSSGSSGNSTVTPDNTGSGDNGQSSSSSSKSSSHHTATSTSSSAESTGTGSASSSSGGTPAGGVVHITDPKCGSNNPSTSVTTSSGPNGEENWFNCGLTGSGGWHPPTMKITEMVYVDLEDAIKMDGNPYGPCSAHIDLFNQYGKQYGIPPIMLAAFAMQESTCNQNVYNSAGTIGMFQLAPQNCPGVDCHDLNTNIEMACKLIIQYLKDAGENVIQMVGEYNGWTPGMTKGKAESAPCDQQQNLDYLQQFFNAWVNGKDGYSVGTYKNCAGDFSRKRSLFVPRFARDQQVERRGWHF